MKFFTIQREEEFQIYDSFCFYSMKFKKKNIKKDIFEF